MRRILFACLGALVLLGATASFTLEIVKLPEVVIADGEGRVKAIFDLPDGKFDHVFVHSVHKTPVEERFRLEADGGGGARLRLYELRYRDSGVGMPADAEGGYTLEGGTFVLSMDRAWTTIPLRVSPLIGHGIRVGGVFHPFLDWAAPGKPLVLSAKLRTIIRFRR